jgi:hypothetical protein
MATGGAALGIPQPPRLWAEKIEQWKQKAAKLGKRESQHQWEIASWMLEGETLAAQAGPKKREEQGKVYDIAEEATGLERSTLRDWAYVARNVAPSLRNDALSFHHHKQVAGLTPSQQEKWLRQAVDERLSVAALRKTIRTTQEGGSAKLKTDRVLSLFNDDEQKKLKRAAQRAKKTPTQFVHDVVMEYLATCK